jgi:hypothetical protein
MWLTLLCEQNYACGITVLWEQSCNLTHCFLGTELQVFHSSVGTGLWFDLQLIGKRTIVWLIVLWEENYSVTLLLEQKYSATLLWEQSSNMTHCSVGTELYFDSLFYGNRTIVSLFCGNSPVIWLTVLWEQIYSVSIFCGKRTTMWLTALWGQNYSVTHCSLRTEL